MKRLVVFGSTGAIGKVLMQKLAPFPHLAITRAMVDLADPNAYEKIIPLLKPSDTIVFLPAITPDKGKDFIAYEKNMFIGLNLVRALKKTGAAHLIYISSDAVYPFQDQPVTEKTPPSPQDLYGAMHLAREILLKTELKIPLTILRPTMVYGISDDHNSYGPNRMRRSANEKGIISLFGKGEEYRDYISAEDAAEIILSCAKEKWIGTLNLCSGKSIAYSDLAKLVASYFDKQIAIEHQERKVPITHRHFDNSAIHKAFPSLILTPLAAGLEKAHQEEFSSSNLMKIES